MSGLSPCVVGFAHSDGGSAEARGQRQKHKAASTQARPLGQALPLEPLVDAAEAARSNLFASVAAVRSALDGAQAASPELSATSNSIRDLLSMGVLSDRTNGSAGSAATAAGKSGEPAEGTSSVYMSDMEGRR